MFCLCVSQTNYFKVTQNSLRAHIGVVPQDTVLFNDTIKYNIAYGRCVEGVSEDEIESAAKAADIHEKILTFPDGWWHEYLMLNNKHIKDIRVLLVNVV
jgi:ABC-type transport system involved in Fe-S cluster assembly fused permease/ATPase subunit